MTQSCKYCKKMINWSAEKNAYLELNGQQHRCEGYFKARELKEKIVSRNTDDLLLQILNELMAIRIILGENNRKKD